MINFGDFRLDRATGRLQRGDIDVPLRAKSLALLRHLVENAGRVITREELLRVIWPGVAVSPSVVRVSVGEIREALGEDPVAPRFIETVGRQGYRFAIDAAGAPVAMPSFVGREAELAQLRGFFERCQAQRRQVVFVAGEPGIGKTALIERFVEPLRGARLARVAQGQCVDLHGAPEPYLPILEMLDRLCVDDEDGEAAAILDRWAPTWLLQMPATVDARAAEALRRRVPNPTRERMLRELGEAMEVLTRKRPLIVVLEDLHWSDVSTIDLLAYLAQINTPARLLVIASYRPADAVVRNQSLRSAVRDILARGRGVEMALELLTVGDIEAYLSRLFAGTPLAPGLAGTIHARTEGNPLFATTTIDYLLERGLLAVADDCWQLAQTEEVVPPSLRALVASELEALSPEEQQLLAAASVVGVEFDALAVAAAIERVPGEVEDRCRHLAERGQFVQATATTTWPDGSIAGTYTFTHSLHRDAVYGRLPPAERARLHRTVGERIESGWVRDPTRVAAILASHFERGLDWPKAVRSHVAAAEASKARLADREVVTHCEAALALLPRLPPSPERDRIEMACSLDLGGSLLAVKGYGTPEVEPLFVRARDLALQLELPQVEIIARGGLYTSEVMGGDQRKAVLLAGDLREMADRFPIPLFLMIGHTALGSSHYNLGNLIDSRRHFELARAAWEPGFPRLPLDSKVLFLGLGAFVFQHLGDSAEGNALIDELVEYSCGLDDPLNAAQAFDMIGCYRFWEGDREQAITWADRAIELAAEHGFPTNEALARINKGHALNALEMQREAFAVLQAAGYRVDMPVHRLGMAEALIVQERWPEAGEEIDLAFAAVESTGEARHVAELHRLRAVCLRALGREQEGVAALNEAIAVARRQQARFFEQRALADL